MSSSSREDSSDDNVYPKVQYGPSPWQKSFHGRKYLL